MELWTLVYFLSFSSIINAESVKNRCFEEIQSDGSNQIAEICKLFFDLRSEIKESFKTYEKTGVFTKKS